MIRRQLVMLILTLCPMFALADQTISGQWRADLGHNVIIVMDVLVDGHWSSQTVQDDKVVAEMAGSYEQTKKTAATGTIVFKPVTAKTSAAHGEAKVEEDTYTLAANGTVLRLVTGGEVMEFHKQPLAK